MPLGTADRQPIYRTPAAKQKAAEVARCNQILANKLLTLHRDPPAAYHCPLGFKSLKEGEAIRRQKSGRPQSAMPGRPTSAPNPVWPPRTDFASKATAERISRQCLASRSNHIMYKKLCESYRVHDSSFAVASKLGRGVDCQPLWRLRSSVYQDEAALLRRPNATGVPKTMGVAACSGCGRKSYYKADGLQLKPCSQCEKVYYCSTTCEALDRLSHQAVCQFNRNGQWSLTRPADQYWTVNKSMAVGRELLRHKEALWSSQTAAEASIKRRVGRVRQQELEAEARQADVEQRHADGLDGPRPCQYMGGKNIVARS
ncbi:hypothetical protein WJX72_006085 [[Myrmecia] bisecta]|uniref:MYND-type domain-containing protein n=1 Tax=[Myrmecia] bisecta TaxID=41462 RepID=A0AAW1R7W6_9CHLO